MDPRHLSGGHVGGAGLDRWSAPLPGSKEANGHATHLAPSLLSGTQRVKENGWVISGSQVQFQQLGAGSRQHRGLEFSKQLSLSAAPSSLHLPLVISKTGPPGLVSHGQSTAEGAGWAIPQLIQPSERGLAAGEGCAGLCHLPGESHGNTGAVLSQAAQHKTRGRGRKRGGDNSCDSVTHQPCCADRADAAAGSGLRAQGQQIVPEGLFPGGVETRCF